MEIGLMIGLAFVAGIVIALQLAILVSVSPTLPRWNAIARPGAASGPIGRALAAVSKRLGKPEEEPPTETVPYRDRMSPDEFSRYAEKRTLQLRKEGRI